MLKSTISGCINVYPKLEKLLSGLNMLYPDVFMFI